MFIATAALPSSLRAPRCSAPAARQRRSPVLHRSGSAVFQRGHTAARRPAKRSGPPKAPAASLSSPSGGEAEVYRGRYKDFTLDDRDRLEVLLYRVSLTGAAAAFEVGTAISLFGGDDVKQAALTPLWFLGAAGIGGALVLIHMYLKNIKMAMQALWAAGVGGSIYIAASQPEPVPTFVLENPWAVWLVGPMFAAFTGLCFKEGACYGKPESFALFALVPLTLLSHLFGLPEGPKDALYGLSAVAIAVLAARKYSQAVKDDVGDKSVFEYLALPSDEERDKWDLAAAQREAMLMYGGGGAAGGGQQQQQQE